jgi:hypothetical protein
MQAENRFTVFDSTMLDRFYEPKGKEIWGWERKLHEKHCHS